MNALCNRETHLHEKLADTELDKDGQHDLIKMKLSVEARLYLVIALASAFVIGELTVGFTTRSIALVADAFHYTGDVLSFAVALWAHKVL